MASDPPREHHQALRAGHRAERRLVRRGRRRVLRHPRPPGRRQDDDAADDRRAREARRGRRLPRRRARHRRVARRPRHLDRLPEPRALPGQDASTTTSRSRSSSARCRRTRSSSGSRACQDAAHRAPAQAQAGKLSGGERQRVALGRAIVRDPKAYLFDEPISALDALLRLEMRTELKRLQRDLGRTLVYVTHDQVEAMSMADRILVLREGVVQQIAPPEDIYHRPANRFVATVVGIAPDELHPGDRGALERHACGRRHASSRSSATARRRSPARRTAPRAGSASAPRTSTSRRAAMRASQRRSTSRSRSAARPSSTSSSATVS